QAADDDRPIVGNDTRRDGALDGDGSNSVRTEGIVECAGGVVATDYRRSGASSGDVDVAVGTEGDFRRAVELEICDLGSVGRHQGAETRLGITGDADHGVSGEI